MTIVHDCVRVTGCSAATGWSESVHQRSEEGHMPHYLIQASYTAEGTKGLLTEGGSSRIAQATALVESVGGTVECLYFAYGADDIIGVCEMPDTSSAAAVSLAVSSTGMASVCLTPLITPGELDAAAEIAAGVAYRPPGS